MSEVAEEMVRDALNAVVRRDVELAQKVLAMDDQVDHYRDQIFRELLTYMMEDPRTIGLCTHLLFVAKNIERSGDHCTNIAEVVYHMVRAGHLAATRPKADVTSETSVPYETHA